MNPNQVNVQINLGLNMGKNQGKKGKSTSVKGYGIGHFRGIRISVGV